MSKENEILKVQAAELLQEQRRIASLLKRQSELSDEYRISAQGARKKFTSAVDSLEDSLSQLHVSDKELRQVKKENKSLKKEIREYQDYCGWVPP